MKVKHGYSRLLPFSLFLSWWTSETRLVVESPLIQFLDLKNLHAALSIARFRTAGLCHRRPPREEILNVLKAQNPRHGMLLTLFRTQQNTSPKGETDPFSSSHENPSWSEPRCYRTLRKLPAGPFILPRGRMKKKEEKERGESENLSRYTLALPMTLCLTCNQNNSNPVTVCISAKFLNFSHRQQALGMTGCLSDSSRICQSPSSQATGKLNASEQGHSYTFPLHAQSGSLAPASRHRGWGPGMFGEDPRPVSTPLPSRSLHPSAFWAVVIARLEINYQVFLLKRNWGGGGENHAADRWKEYSQIK